MFEVIPKGNGFTWQMICAAGRVLVYTSEVFPCTFSAAKAAKAYRQDIWGLGLTIDNRQGACI